ncbi:hypothetical protein [Streptosporangium sp. NPDC002524]|uniref:hypothetical protein n=1 Tax=Streptosporangium sp. NPDC002524 TaxID=3154537 RepID=UPI003327D034
MRATVTVATLDTLRGTARAGTAHRVVVVADSSKLGARAFARICPCEDIDVLVTDGDAPAVTVRRFAEAGIEVVQA